MQHEFTESSILLENCHPFCRQGERYSDAHADIEANVICQHKNSPRAIIAKAATKEDYERWIIQFKWIVERLISR